MTATNTVCRYGLLSRHDDSGSVFYAWDPRGNACQRLSATGAVLSTQAFDAFGTRYSTDGSVDPYAGFGGLDGYYTDAETGLALCTFRYYDPAAQPISTARQPHRLPHHGLIGYNGA